MVEFSRRRFLLNSCAVITTTIGLGWPAHAMTVKSGENSIGFSGPNLIQLVIYDTKISTPRAYPVQSDDVLKWKPNYQKRNG